AFYSYFHLHGLFVVTTILFVGVVGTIKQKKFPTFYFFGLSLLVFSFLIFNYRLIDIYFLQRDWFIPHRLEYDIYSFGADHNEFFKSTLALLFLGPFHSIQTSPILFGSVLILYVVFSFSHSDSISKYAKSAFIGAVAFSAFAM